MIKEASSPILEVKNLTKKYRHGNEEIEAVKGVSFCLAEGDFVAVMGASGSGKSTLLHVVAGLTSPNEGSVKIKGRDIFALSDVERTHFRRQEVGLIFQAYNLIPTLTGEENIALPILLGGGRYENGDVAGLVSKLGLNDVSGRRPDSMSGGEQQRVAIGRALVTNPSLILADEPTGNLDSMNSVRLCAMLKRLCVDGRRTVLMVTHNPVVAFWAEKIVVLKDGQIRQVLKREAYPTVQEFAQHYVSLIDGDYQEVAQ